MLEFMGISSNPLEGKRLRNLIVFKHITLSGVMKMIMLYFMFLLSIFQETAT